MTLQMRTAFAAIVSIVIVTGVVFVGNQRQAFAQSLAQDLICEIYFELSELGQPIPPGISSEGCEGFEEPEVPTDLPQCADGTDNDGDGLQDYLPALPGEGDPGCDSIMDDDETNVPTGGDGDGDGDGAAGGEIYTGRATSNAGSINVLNTTLVRVMR